MSRWTDLAAERRRTHAPNANSAVSANSPAPRKGDPIGTIGANGTGRVEAEPAPPWRHRVPFGAIGANGTGASAAEAPPPCPSDVTERAAIIAEGNDCSREESDRRALAEHGFASWQTLAVAHAAHIQRALDRLPPLADRDAQRLADASRALLATPWFTQAVELGWSMPELFGVDAHAPKVRSEHFGLVPYLTWSALRGPKLVAISADGFTVETASGARLRGRRAPYIAARQVPWWQVFIRPEGTQNAV
jgi:hypothetical protein